MNESTFNEFRTKCPHYEYTAIRQQAPKQHLCTINVHFDMSEAKDCCLEGCGFAHWFELLDKKIEMVERRLDHMERDLRSNRRLTNYTLYG
jgi:hypothetical protein